MPEVPATGQAIPYARFGRSWRRGAAGVAAWYVETNRFGHYVVFDADEHVAEALAGRLDDVGLDVIRWDESFRPADNGIQYDWFVRLGFDGDKADVIRLVDAQVAGHGQKTRRPSTGRRLGRTNAEQSRQNLRSWPRLRLTRQELPRPKTTSSDGAHDHAQARATETESEELRKELASGNRTRSRLRTEVKSLRKQVADLPAPSTKDEDAADIPSEAAQWYEAFAEADEELLCDAWTASPSSRRLPSARHDWTS